MSLSVFAGSRGSRRPVLIHEMPPAGWRLRRVRHVSGSLLRELSDLLKLVGMRARRPKELSRAIQSSDLSIVAFDGRRLVGFGRLISDRSYYGTLWDIAVHPSYHRRGLGSAIVERLLVKARDRKLVMVGLFTSAANFAFYRQLKFKVLNDIHPMTASPTAWGGNKPVRRGGHD
jgi:ribosomal protein S18 acetylase RimI-like enzyme